MSTTNEVSPNMPSSQDSSFPFTFDILSSTDVANYKTADGKVDPVNMVHYKDDQNEDVTPLPLYVPQEQLEAELDKEEMERRSTKPHSIMQTFLKMSSVVYSMAGLGSIEESKVYKDQFEEEPGSRDSLREEVNQMAPGSEQKSDQDLSVFDEAAEVKQTLSTKEVKDQIDILLKETDTIWMFVLPGTCKEIEGDENVHKALRKRKGETKAATTDTSDDAEVEKGFLAEDVYTEDDKIIDEEEEKRKEEEKKKEEQEAAEQEAKAAEKKSEEESEEPTYVKHKYDLNEKWSQTIDFPRKKKGTQSDAIVTADSYAQVTSKDLLL